jgi:hypothetical protein
MPPWRSSTGCSQPIRTTQPVYFMAAQTLVKAGRTEEAKARLAQGIASAQRTGNAHALGEMQALLSELE